MADERVEQVFEAYLLRQETGAAESEPDFLAANESIREELEQLLRDQQEMEDELRELAADRRASRKAAPPQRELGDYRILRELGRGGMGVVYEAEHLPLERLVALKVLPARASLNQQAVARFRREALVEARLEHPNIVRVLDVGEEDGTHYLAMEFLRGTPLDLLIRRLSEESVVSVSGAELRHAVEVQAHHPLDSDRWKEESDSRRGSSAWNKDYVVTVTEFALQIAEALEHAHQAGIIHRDVKPSNIIVRENGVAVLTDFGLAQEKGGAGLTRTGEFAGTVNYSSPEQALGSGRVRMDHRTDIFSLGATLYELLTLRQAFGGENVHRVIAAIASKEPVHPQRLNPAIPRDLVTILLKMLEKDPDRRYASAGELAQDLRAFLSFKPIRARPTPTLMRCLRWTRREPLKAAVLGMLAFGVPALALLGREVLAQRRVLELAQVETELERGFLELAYGNGERASEVFRGILGVHAGHEEAVAGSCLARIAAGAFDEALAVLEDGEVEAESLQWLRAHALHASGKVEAAEKLRERLGAPSSALAHYLAGELALLDGRGGRIGAFDEALEHFEQAVLFSEFTRALYHSARIRAATRDGEPRGVITILDESHKRAERTGARARQQRIAMESAAVLERRWSDSAQTLYLTALAKWRGSPSGAIHSLRLALQHDPQYYLAHMKLGSYLAMLGQMEEALEHLRVAAEIAPKNADVQVILGHVHSLRRDWPGAERSYHAALAIDPRDIVALNNLGNTYMEQGSLQLAVAQLEEALKLAPSYLDARENLASCMYQLENYERALDEIQACLEKSPEREAYDRALEGACFFELGRYEESLSSLERATELKSSNANFAYLRARTHAFLEQWELAIEWFERAVELEPSNETYRDDVALAYNKYAWACVGSNVPADRLDPGPGLDAALQAVELTQEENPGYLDTLAWAYYRNDDLDAATQALESAVALLDDPSQAQTRAGFQATIEKFEAERDLQRSGSTDDR